ncbi:MAG: tRNA epoxyqueuosine(34) reductase QueG [Acidobacteria bacterium]|nr:tRNA epoxyqueuosine(34) reductase QueG [Acidobacteriota bacterium]
MFDPQSWNGPPFDELREMAQKSGFAEIGAAPAGPVTHPNRIRDWVARGYHAGMGWFARSLEKRLDPRLVVPNAQSVLVLLTPYTPQPVKLGPYNLARYAAGDDYHDVLLKPLIQLCQHMERLFPGSRQRAYVDTGPVLERYWAERSGLGWIGKNGCLISKAYGSTVFLSTVVTTIRLPWSQPHPFHCGQCRACLDACPTDAFPEPFVVDSNRCISYLTIEHRGDLPRHLDFANWVFGCDICQEVCPWTHKFAQPPRLEQFRPRPAYQDLTSRELNEISEDAFRHLFRKSPVKRAKQIGLARNIRYLTDRDPDGRPVL